MFRLSSSSSSRSIGLFSPSLLLRATGTVKQWSSPGNFGFVLDDETEKHLFVPVNELVFADPLETKRFLVPLQRVRYDRVPRSSKNKNKKNASSSSSSSSLVVNEMCVRVRDISGKALLSPLLMNGVSRSNQHLTNYLNNNNSNNNSTFNNNLNFKNNNNIVRFGMNFGGVVTQLHGMFGFISSNHNHSNVKFCVRDVMHLQGNFHDYIRVGDRVTFDLVADPNSTWIHEMCKY